MKQKLEIAAIITPGEIFPIFFSSYHGLKMCLKTLLHGQFLAPISKKTHINSFTSTLLTNTESMLYFWTFPKGFFFQGVNNTTLAQFGLRSYLML